MDALACVVSESVAQILFGLLKSLARANATLTDISELLRDIQEKLK